MWMGGSGVAGKILICLLLWKNMHIHLAFRFSKGRTEEMGTCHVLCVCVCLSLCICTHVCVRRSSLNGPVFMCPNFVPLACGYHSNFNDLAPQTGSKKGHVCSLALLKIYSAKLKGRVLVILMEWLTHCQRLTGSLSGRLSDWLGFWTLCWLPVWWLCGSKLNDW